MENEKYYEEIIKKIKDTFKRLRDCINDREKIILENLDKTKNKKDKIEFLEKNINEITKKKNLSKIIMD